MNRICIAQFGIYDLPSLGDTMFPTIFADNMKKIMGKDNVKIDIYSPTSCDKPYNNLPKVYSIDELEERNKSLHYDAFVLGGGEFIHFDDVGYKTIDGTQREYTTGELWLKPTKIAHDLGIPIYWDGVGVSYDFVEEYQRKTIREVSEFVKKITVRDKYSAQRLLDAGVKKEIYVSPDMLWMFKNSISISELESTYNKLADEYSFLKKPYMVVQYATKYKSEEVAKQAVEFSKKENLTPVSLVVNYCHDDTKLSKELTYFDSSFKSVDRMLQPIEIMAIIYKAKIFWGSSLHGNLISMLYGVPNIILDMYPNTVSKMDGLMSWLDCTERRCLLPEALSRMSDKLLDKDEINLVKMQASKLCDQEYTHLENLYKDILKEDCFLEKAIDKQNLSCKGYIESKDDFKISISTRKNDRTFEFIFDGPIEKDSRFVLYSKDCSLANVYFDDKKLPLKDIGDGLNNEKGSYIWGRTEFDLPEINNEKFSIVASIEKINFSECYDKLTATLNNKNAHIEQLLQSERDLIKQISIFSSQSQEYKNEVNNLTKEKQYLYESLSRYTNECTELKKQLEDINITLRNKEGHIELLLQSERDLTNKINMSFIRKIANKMLPIGTRRRKIFKLLGKSIKHPNKAIKALSPKHVVTLFRELKNGEIELLETQFNLAVLGVEIHPVEVEIGTVDTEKKKRIDDYDKLLFKQFNNPLVSIIIPVYNQFNYTYLCLKSILDNSGDIEYEVIIADDCSTDFTKDITKCVKGINVQKTQNNLRFLLNCNNAAKAARGKYVLFLNNDTQVQKDWLKPLVDLIESDQKIGMVGSKLVYPDGLLQEAGGILWKDGSAWNFGNRQDANASEFNYVKEVDYISGAAIMIKHSLWKELGGFDELFVPAYCEDSDLAFKVREAGYKVLYQPKSVVVHFEGISNGTDVNSGLKAYQVENSKKFYNKWKDVLEKEHEENGVDVFHARDKSFNKPCILIIDHYVPTFDMDAGSKTVYAYIKLFINQGYNVKFIGDNFYQSEPYTTALQQLGVEVLYGPYYAQHWQDWIKDNARAFNYILLNRPHISIKYIDFIKENTSAKIIYYGHDLAFLRLSREAEITGDKELLNESKQWKEIELSLMRKADMAYYPSEIEIDVIHDCDKKINAKAIPGFLFDNINKSDYSINDRKDLMFIGGFAHRPNIDAVEWMAKEIMPLLRKKVPEVRIHIIGSKMPDSFKNYESDDFILEGRLSDEELDNFYKKSRMVIVPLRYGAGIKGKVVEAMKNGVPIVTTSCGAEGICNSSKALIVADTAQEIVDAIASAYNNADLLKKISNEEIKYVKKHYSQNAAVIQLSAEFEFKEVNDNDNN